MKSSFLLRLKEVVNQYPENIALSDQNQILSFKKLEMRLINISHKLEEIGVKEGDRIALWMKKSSDYILSLLACLRLGCIFIPIDEKTPLKRVSWILNDAEASWVLTDNLEFITQNESLSIENLATKLIQISEKEKSKNMKGAYIIYTSGST
ncbi:MAG TPA: AMP-binding protein, partial [Leptospiraceae bacterium]|nr:AMP-binding protein [Leptospiraceae bacterium]